MFKINISGAIYEADEIRIEGGNLFIDGKNYGPVGFTFVSKVIEGEYEFSKKDGVVRWTSK